MVVWNLKSLSGRVLSLCYCTISLRILWDVLACAPQLKKCCKMPVSNNEWLLLHNFTETIYAWITSGVREQLLINTFSSYHSSGFYFADDQSFIHLMFWTIFVAIQSRQSDNCTYYTQRLVKCCTCTLSGLFSFYSSSSAISKGKLMSYKQRENVFVSEKLNCWVWY